MRRSKPTPRAWFAVAVIAAALLAGCRRNPIERLVNPYSDSTVPGMSGTYTIYDDELKTGGAVGFIPFGENQAIDFSDITSPRRTQRQIKYVWTGVDTSSTTPGATQHDFAGFSLFVEPTIEEAVVSAGRNLSGVGYTKLKLFVRGSLSEGNTLRIEGPDDGNSNTTPARVEISRDELSNDAWQEVEISIPLSDLIAVKVFMTVSIQYAQPPRTTAAGNGGTIYLDDVRYE